MPKARDPVERIMRSLRAGAYAMMILGILEDSETPLHGYAILREIDERSGGLLRPTESIVYETLRRLEKDGLIRGEWVIPGSRGPPRRVYTITGRGRQVLHTLRGEAARLAEALGLCGG